MQDFILPDIGEGIVECEVVKWLVAEGESIVEDQAVVEVMTDKALVEIPAKYTGVVVKLHYAQGDIAKVHTPLFAMQVEGESEILAMSQSNSPIEKPTQEANTQTSEKTNTSSNAKALASPAVRRMAREMDVDLTTVAGSGEKGRVLKADLNNTNNQPQTTAQHLFVEDGTNGGIKGGTRVEPIKGIKAAMAKHMSHSVFTVPHFSVSEEIQMCNLIGARAQLKESFSEQGVKLSFMPFFIKALSLALQQFPIINSQVNADCTEITYFDDHNIGIAVDSKVGLVVPNIKRVQDLSLFEVAQQVNDIIELARSGRLTNKELKGGTISISNIGVLGGTVSTPVINAPESAIVALGKMQRLPRFDENDQVMAVNMMQISWSGDHRIIDGATMVRFNNLWKSYLENPLTMLSMTR
jgi:2-oxoisovalerate dehydrogenase E2 component (dihydrolipoyl transacylase)